MGSRLTIATAATPNLEWWPLAVNCYRSFLDFNYPNKNPIVEKIVNYHRPASWYKIKLILSQPDGWFLWVDSDAKIYNPDFDLDKIKEDGKFLYLSSDQNGLNAGVMLIYINDVTRKFFSHAYSLVEYIGWKWQEQHAIEAIIKSNNLNCREWIKVLKSSEFNCYSIGEYEADAAFVSLEKPFIYHTPAIPVVERQKRLLNLKKIEHRNSIGELFEGKEVVGAEIGVQVGRYAYNVLNRFCHQLNLIDPWTHFNNYLDIANTTVPQKEYEFSLVSKMFKDSNVNIIRQTSKEASKMFQDKSLDFVYIDANHSYNSVKEDMELWWPKVKDGGFLCGHDYMNTKEGNTVIEVKSAVDNFVEKNEISHGFITCEEYPSWFIKK